MGNCLNTRPRRKVFKEVIQTQLLSKMTLLKYDWGLSCRGINCQPYFNNMLLSMTRNGMHVQKYGTLLNPRSHLIIATLPETWNSFASQKRMVWLMLLFVKRQRYSKMTLTLILMMWKSAILT